MTSEPARRGRAGHVVTAAVVVICVAILCGLGAWQLFIRLPWKLDYLHRVAAAQAAPPRPLAEVLADQARGQDIEYDRVIVRCLPGPTASLFVWDVQGDRHGWRALSPCSYGPGEAVAVDRGFIQVPRGQLEVPHVTLPPIGQATGQLRRPSRAGWFDQAGDAAHGFHSRVAAVAALSRRAPARYLPLLVVAEGEAPAPAGVTPLPLAADIPNNHLSYAITWFGLAIALIAIYVAALVTRRRR